MRYNKENQCADGCMTKPVPAVQPIELDSADETIALQMTRWLSHLRAERRLSPKTLEAYARDVRQCLDFLCEYWGTRVTLARFSLLEARRRAAARCRRRARGYRQGQQDPHGAGAAKRAGADRRLRGGVPASAYPRGADLCRRPRRSAQGPHHPAHHGAIARRIGAAR